MKGFGNLLEGYRRFRANRFEAARAQFQQLAEGQAPRAVVIACCDSRADPATIFDTNPGEIFVVRNVANLVPPFETGGGRHGVSAALEFAVTQLEVPEIVVMGHGQCGGVQASISRRFDNAPPGEGGFIAHWIDLMDEARDAVVAQHGEGDAALRELERETVRLSLANLRSFPPVAAREAAGRLRLHGAYFAIADGRLHLLDEATGEFAPL